MQTAGDVVKKLTGHLEGITVCSNGWLLGLAK